MQSVPPPGAASTSEAHYRALIENSAELVAVLDADGRIRLVHGPVEQTLAVSAAELVGRSVFEMIAPADTETAAAA
ncbi:MAG TPA: PAS domain S-box protein, partial [Longimicrobium sp.]|nr:PAS domain S-box protein [Longimicrobium sp.]